MVLDSHRPVRVRFAPSPSGALHVGNARTALFNWLLARGHDGTLVVRVEDTDAARSSREAEAAALADLRWLGLDWDEGVEAGGDHGPYRQSDRLHIYRAYAVELLAGGHAYQCFCSPAQLEADRANALAAGQSPRYPGRCRVLSREDAKRRVGQGELAVVRFRVPEGRDVAFHDLVRGTVRVSTMVVGDPVLLRSDGTPAYNFAVVVDDALMAITHVLRAEDHVSNTPRQVLLYEAFGWTPPVFAHVPLVMGPDHAKLSKRHGATSVAEFRANGYLPEALANYLALLGWSPGDGEELLPLDELARRFRVEDVGRSAGVFDPEKLAWANRHYLKQATPSRLALLVTPYLQEAGWLSEAGPDARAFLEATVPALAGEVDRIADMLGRIRFLFDYAPQRALDDPALRAEATAAHSVLEALASELDESPPLIDRETFRAAAARVTARTGAKGRALFHPIRLALTGESSGLELDSAVPAIDRGAALPADSGLAPITSAQQRARAFVEALAGGGC